jgi:hypothetical protein
VGRGKAASDLKISSTESSRPGLCKEWGSCTSQAKKEKHFDEQSHLLKIRLAIQSEEKDG